MVARYGAATEGLFEPGTEADPGTVAEEITRILRLPAGQKPFRSVVDFTGSNVDEVNAVNRSSSADFLSRMGYRELLQIKK